MVGFSAAPSKVLTLYAPFPKNYVCKYTIGSGQTIETEDVVPKYTINTNHGNLNYSTGSCLTETPLTSTINVPVKGIYSLKVQQGFYAPNVMSTTSKSWSLFIGAYINGETVNPIVSNTNSGVFNSKKPNTVSFDRDFLFNQGDTLQVVVQLKNEAQESVGEIGGSWNIMASEESFISLKLLEVIV
jgi:hypothetical protein